MTPEAMKRVKDNILVPKVFKLPHNPFTVEGPDVNNHYKLGNMLVDEEGLCQFHKAMQEYVTKTYGNPPKGPYFK